MSLLLILVCVAAQSTWPTALRIEGQAPDLALAAVICVGLGTGAASGAVCGFLGALVGGSVSSSPLGHLFISHMSLGFAAGAMRGRVFADRALMAVVLVGVSVIIAALLQMLLAPPASPQPWIVQMLARAAYSGLLAAPVYMAVRSLRRFYPEPEMM